MEFMKSSPLKTPYSRSAARADETGRAARDIVAQDAALRSRNTERLKAARLARDAALPPVVAAPAPPPKRRRKVAAT